MLKDVVGFAEHQEKAIYGLGYKLTITRKNNNVVLNKATAPNVVEAKIVISGLDWFVPQHTPSVEQQALLSKPILRKTPTGLQCVEKTVFMEDVNN